MDFYAYYTERLGWGSNPYVAVAQCQQIVTEMLDNPHIPFKIAAESSVGFLAALADFAGDGCTVTMAYDTVMNSTIEAFHRMHDATDARDKAWCQEMLEAEQEASGVPPLYDPGNYEVQPEDIDPFEEEYDPDKEEPVSTLDAIQEALCAGCEAGAGVRRPFPDWDHISSWTQTDWIKMQTFKSKMLAAAGHDFFTMGPAIDALAAAKEAMPHIPLPRQVELSMLAVEIVDGLIDGLETNLQALCARSLHTHQGRRIQQEMCCPNKNGLNQVP